MNIAILVPSKGRPEGCKKLLDSISKTAENLPNVYLMYQKDESKQYQFNLAGYWPGVTQWSTQEWLPTVQKWNDLCDLALQNKDNKLFMLGSDDIVFTTPLWDKELLEHYNALKNKVHVYHFQDSRDKDGTPHPIVTREYIETMGYFLPPIFLHWYCDTWTVDIAKANGCFTHLKNYELAHIKPSDKGIADATHSGIRAQEWNRRDSYVFSKCSNYLALEKQKLASFINNSNIRRWYASN
jgi:hypothetical protein